MKRRIAIFIAIAAVVAAAAGTVDLINKNGRGLALRGYDPVAYFTRGVAAKGSPEFSYEWMGARWQFTSAGNRDSFAQQADKYAPQFGGYCAWAISNNYTADADPEAWKIVEGKLYLNYNKSVQKKWEKELPKRIEDGNRNWPGPHRK